MVGNLVGVGVEEVGSLMVGVGEGVGSHLVEEGMVHFLLEEVGNLMVEEGVVVGSLMVVVAVVVGSHLVVVASVEQQRHRPGQPRTKI